MDGTKVDDGKLAVQAARPAVTTSDSTAASNGPLGAPPEANGCGEELDDDEQVERFYALLANIRAMRRVYTPAGGEAAVGGGGERKRPRGASEPPWRPAFRLEDFEDDATATSRWARKKERSQLPDDGEENGDGSVVMSPSMSPPPRAGAGARRAGTNSNSI